MGPVSTDNIHLNFNAHEGKKKGQHRHRDHSGENNLMSAVNGNVNVDLGSMNPMNINNPINMNDPLSTNMNNLSNMKMNNLVGNANINNLGNANMNNLSNFSNLNNVNNLNDIK